MKGELEQPGERIAAQAAHLDAAMHQLLTDLREFDARYCRRFDSESHFAVPRRSTHTGTALVTVFAAS